MNRNAGVVVDGIADGDPRPELMLATSRVLLLA
jgi:hypothetical protein